MVGWIVALISGVLMSIQGVLNTEVTKQTSLWVSTGWVQLSALIVCITAWLIRDRSSAINFFIHKAVSNHISRLQLFISNLLFLLLTAAGESAALFQDYL